MRYAFLSNVLDWGQIGGPQSCSLGIETFLQRYADFEYTVIRDHFADFLRSTNADIVHIQSNMDIITTALRQNVRLIVGPNVIWQTATPELLSYLNMGAVLMLRQELYPGNLDPVWFHKVRFFPPFVDEQFFIPSGRHKDIDVLTISKSFHYPEYELNLRKLIVALKPLKLKHLHLGRYSPEQYREALDRSKALLFPSPRESGASICFALLECSIMNVPFVALESGVDPRPEEFDTCRGIFVPTIQNMIDVLPTVLNGEFLPREWTETRFSMWAAYQRLRAIIEFGIRGM